MSKEKEDEGETDRTGLFDLPEEILHHIVSFLSLQDLCHMGATCRFAYCLTHNESFWAFQMLKDSKLLYVPASAELRQHWPHSRFTVDGVLCDPNMQGNRELYIIYSTEFRRITRDKWNKKKRKDPFRTMLEYNSVKDILPKLLAFYVSLPQEEQTSSRLVLFGPGIESERTQDLVHKIVNARSSTFDAVEFIRGLQGGVGSGVRINYKHMYNFDLMCLYTNRHRERLDNKGEARLNPAHNITIVKDSSGNLSLRPEIIKLLPTLHALVFALDVTLEDEMNVKSSLALMRKELDILIQGLQTFHIQLPLIVMACSERGGSPRIPVREIISGLRLEEFSFAWGVWSVEVDNMRGAEKGFDWVLHHLRKKRKDWNYHTNQAQT